MLRLRKIVAWAVPLLSLVDIGLSYLMLRMIGDSIDQFELNKAVVFLVKQFNLEIALVLIFGIICMITFLVHYFWKYRIVRWYGVFLLGTRLLVLPWNIHKVATFFYIINSA